MAQGDDRGLLGRLVYYPPSVARTTTLAKNMEIERVIKICKNMVRKIERGIAPGGAQKQGRNKVRRESRGDAHMRELLYSSYSYTEYY